MANWHDAKGGPEQGKASEGYGNSTSQGRGPSAAETLSSPERYDKRTSQGVGAEPSVTAAKPDRGIVVIALDPGVTTGIATGLIRNGHMEVGSSQDKMEVWDMFVALKGFKPDHVIFERFDYRRHKHRDGLELFSRELIGVIRLWAKLESMTRSVGIYAQTPAEGVGGYYSDATLKKEGVFKSGNPHANDAMRHLLQWYTFKAGYKFNTTGFSPG